MCFWEKYKRTKNPAFRYVFDSEVRYSDPHLTYLTESRIINKIIWSHAVVVQVSKLSLKMFVNACTNQGY